ncbi:MAG: hypothetical protein QW065_05035 [Acidilobaceae archaeon]
MSKKIIAAILASLIAFLSVIVAGGAFAYKWSYGTTLIDRPHVWFEDPRTPNVVVTLYRNKTIAEVSVNTNYRLIRIHRSAVFFDTFDSDPFAGRRMTSLTCTWGWSSSYGTISISAGSRGHPRWDRECIALAELDVSSYAREGRKIYIASLAWRTGYDASPSIRADSVYVNTTKYMFYRVGFNATIISGRTGDMISSTILYGTTVLDHVPLGVRLTLEYYYLSQVVTAINFRTWTAEHWNVTMLNYVNIGDTQRFYPDRVGVGYRTDTSQVSGTFYFDNFLVTLDKPPWFVNITNLPDGWRARIVPRQGSPVFEATSIGGLASIPVWAPQLDLSTVTYSASTDYGFVFRNARIEVLDERGNIVYSAVFDYVIGGDVYRFGFEGDILHVYSSSSTGFYLKLTALSTYCTGPGTRTTLSLTSQSGNVAPSYIVLKDGVLLTNSTGILYVSPPPQWSTSWFAAKIKMKAFSPSGVSCRLELILEQWVSEGVKAYYPITLTVVGS